MNNNQLNRIQFNDNNNIEIKQDNLNQAYQPPEVAAATIQKRFQLVQALKKQDFEEDDILDEEYDKLNMISDNKIENQLKQERNDINIQDQIVNDMYQQVISESTFILLQNILNELNRFSVKDLFLKFYSELESFYQNTEQKIYKYLNTFVIDRLLKNFQLLLRFDLDYQLLIKKYLHFVYQNVKYDEKRMKFDINLYFYKKDVSDEKSQQLNPQNWIYLPQQCLQSYLERLQSLVKQAFQNFYNSPFETLIEEGQEVYSLYDLNQPQNRLFEKTQLGFVHSIRKSIELTDFQINSQDKQNLIELLNQFFIKYNENDQNKIELLILYKKIEILYKRVINGPIEDFKDQINSLMIKNIKSYIDQINDYKQNIELSELQEPIIEFVNTYYLDYQINAYLNKIKKIIGEYKQIKSKQSEIKMETSQTYIQEILNFVSNQFIVSFKEILTKSTVKTLIQYLKENKFTQAQQNLIQKKELTLLLCKQIGQKVYPNEFKKQPSQMSMTSIQSDFNYYYEEKKSNQNSLENSSKRQEDRGNQQNMMNQDNSSFSQNIFKNKNLLRLEEKTVFQENSRDEEFNYEKKEIQDFNKFLQKFNQECQLENHSYEILQNLNEKSKFSSNNHYVIIFLETNYFLIIRPSTKQAKIIVNTQINKQPGYFNQIVTDLSLYYEKLNMRPISQKKNQNQQLSLKEQFELLYVWKQSYEVQLEQTY
ncbi:hypothetical protein TTHERM_000011448 (macronuclear) [Tetrahymena thermophila SB210]|uniref:Uncharacterized protein n=1 Tax=Tetrahymena thermophila (strain SB210) TaxID=312017 RepID=W7XAD1_TETTS|nr:hypothetical protein TTHERM_000011448 [Tetrahymena thermophila SB210]EWS76335.1 hypothetical protein TTHERM_000011448 [Tetrahymena thermophila SB210]|eukprot:XP_012651119.1 hypothetical protein TTHERM_000011448 [Tetrahymena thermophila SB210]